MIRLSRVGRKNDPSFRIVVTDKRNAAKSGKFLEVVGNYDARKGTPSINADRVKYFLDHGAKSTGTVHNLLVDAGIVSGKKINVLPRKHPPQETPTPEAQGAEQAEGVGVPTSDAPAGAGEVSGEEVKGEIKEEIKEAEKTEETPAPETPAEIPVEAPSA